MINYIVKNLKRIENPAIIKKFLQISEGDKMHGLILTTEKFWGRDPDFKKSCNKLEEYLKDCRLKYSILITNQGKYKKKMVRMMVCQLEKIEVSYNSVKYEVTFGIRMIVPNEEIAKSIEQD